MDRFAVVITAQDAERLRRLIATQRGRLHTAAVGRLAAKLDGAVIVKTAQVPADVITMYTRVRIRHLDSHRAADHTLVLPDHADLGSNRLSVLTPLGSALIGQREGDEVRWSTPDGVRRLRVGAILYQPEAMRGARRRWPPRHWTVTGPARSVALHWDARQPGRGRPTGKADERGVMAPGQDRCGIQVAL